MTSNEYRQIRRQMDLTQAQLSRLTGMKQEAISVIESGERRVMKHHDAAIRVIEIAWNHGFLPVLLEEMK